MRKIIISFAIVLTLLVFFSVSITYATSYSGTTFVSGFGGTGTGLPLVFDSSGNLYVATDQNGLAATSTRTVIIEPAAAPSIIPSAAASTTNATSTAQ